MLDCLANVDGGQTAGNLGFQSQILNIFKDNEDSSQIQEAIDTVLSKARLNFKGTYVIEKRILRKEGAGSHQYLSLNKPDLLGVVSESAEATGKPS